MAWSMTLTGLSRAEGDPDFRHYKEKKTENEGPSENVGFTY